MTVEQIIKQVRWCIDEEAQNQAEIEDVSAFDFEDGSHTDFGTMDNIIRNKIGTALRWVCLYAPAEQLSGAASGNADSIDIIKEETKSTASGYITLDAAFIRMLRVRGTSWHRAITGDSILKEDSDEYLQLRDEYGAKATVERPQAAILNTKIKQVEVRPYENDQFTLTYVVTPSVADLQGLDNPNTEVGIPPMVETSFIYYLAYLLLSAYGDDRAKNMLDIAMLNLGRSEDKQRQ